MRGISKEQRQEARRLIDATLALHNNAPQLLDLGIPTEDDLKAAVHQVLYARAMEELARIDVETLGNGIRMGGLRAAGIYTVAHVLTSPLFELQSVPGIGSKSSDLLVRRAKAALDTAMEAAPVHIDADTRPYDHYQLIRALYLQRELPVYELVATECARWMESLLGEAQLAETAASQLRTLFAGRQRLDRALEAIDRLRRELPQLQAKMYELHDYVRAVHNTPAETIWQDFEARAAEYYARISTLAQVSLRERSGNLPVDLVELIDAFPLDTTLLRATLRPYQHFGAQFALYQGRTLIGDEMGLGKTVEAIAAMSHLAAQGETHFLVVCPLSVLVNWGREVPQHSALNAVPVYGDTRDVAFAYWCDEGGVCVTTYETIQRLSWSDAPEPALLVVDEAHYVKNPEAKRSVAVAGLAARARRVLLLSGTPLENRVGEMTALMGMLDPELVRVLGEPALLNNPVAYRKAVAPRYLRRTRADVLKELPEKLEKTDWCTLSPADRFDYLEALRHGTFNDLRRVSWRHGHMGDSSKAQRLVEICAEAASGHHKVLVFTYFLDTLRTVAALLASDCAGVIDGSTSPTERQRIVDEFAESDKSVLACQVTAGGTGLNIQAASVVVFCEPQLKPSAEDQAISRAYRMGQVRTVVVHRLLMSDTIDERIEAILRRKEAVFDEYADRSETGEQASNLIDARMTQELVAAELERYGVERDEEAPLGEAQGNSVDEAPTN